MQDEQNPFGETNPYQVSSAELTSGEFPTEVAAQAKRGNFGFAVVAVAMFGLAAMFAISILLTFLGAAVSFLPSPDSGGSSALAAFAWILVIPAWGALFAVPVGQLICYRIPTSVVSKRLLLFCYPGYVVPIVFALFARLFAGAPFGSSNWLTVLMIIGVVMVYLWPYVSQLLFLSHVRQVAQRVGAERAASTAFVARMGLLCLPLVLFGLGLSSAFLFGGGSAFLFGGGSWIGVVFSVVGFGIALLSVGVIVAYGLSCWQLFRFVSSVDETLGTPGGFSADS
ncbi:MAG: hypothetical protein CBB71_14975 [Rhodopirellula sp. TMED11]|nr:MAG: hypothetical protein CBB71_14975 [Rhodopirellula sp. TMED11]